MRITVLVVAVLTLVSGFAGARAAEPVCLVAEGRGRGDCLARSGGGRRAACGPRDSGAPWRRCPARSWKFWPRPPATAA